MVDPMMPDLSHLSEEERKIIEEVLQRQKAEENKEAELIRKNEQELKDIEKELKVRMEWAQKVVGTQDDALCQICQKVKFTDGIGRKCAYCALRFCVRCGGKHTVKLKPNPDKPNQPATKQVLACSLCQKKHDLLAKSGKWFMPKDEPGSENQRPTTPTGAARSQTPTSAAGKPLSTSQSIGAMKATQPTGTSGPGTGQTQPQSQSNQPQANHAPARRQNSLQRQQTVDSRDGRPPAQGGYDQKDQRRPLDDRGRPLPDTATSQDQQRRQSQADDLRRGDSRRSDPRDRRYPDDRRREGSPPRHDQADRDRDRGYRDRDPRDRGPPHPDDRDRRLPPKDDRDRRPPLDDRDRRPDSRDGYRHSDDRRYPVDDRRLPPSAQDNRDLRAYPDHDRRSVDSRDIGFDRRPSDERRLPVDDRRAPDDRDRRYPADDRRRSGDSMRLEDDLRRGTAGGGPPIHDRSRSPPSQRDTPPDRQRNEPLRQAQPVFDSRGREIAPRDYDQRDSRDRDRLPNGGDHHMPLQERILQQERRYASEPAYGTAARPESPQYTDSRRPPPQYDDRQTLQGTPPRGGPPLPSTRDIRGQSLPPAQQHQQPYDQRMPPGRQASLDSHSRMDERYAVTPPSADFRDPRGPPPLVQQGPVSTSRVVDERRISASVDSRTGLPVGPEHQRSKQSSLYDDGRSSPGSTARRRLENDYNNHQDSLSSESDVQRRRSAAGTIQPTNTLPPGAPTRIHAHPPHHRPKRTTRHAVNTNARQLQRSPSSSDDEIRSTPDATSVEDYELESDVLSDKGRLARYLGGSKSAMQNSRIISSGKASAFEPVHRTRTAPPSPLAPPFRDDEILAAKIRKFLALPVTWQPNADGNRLIGHMILQKRPGGSLGMKVQGGLRKRNGQLGAIIKRVQKSGVADTVGRLREGDEVLEWNGRPFQNLTHDEVCLIVNDSKFEPQVELIVSRKLPNLADDLSMLDFQVATTPTPRTILDDCSSRVSSNNGFLSQIFGQSDFTRAGTASLDGVKSIFAPTCRTVLFCPLCCVYAQSEPVVSATELLPRQPVPAIALQQPMPLGLQMTYPQQIGPSVIGPVPQLNLGGSSYPSQPTPMVMVTGPPPQDPTVFVPPPALQQTQSNVFGQITLSLYHDVVESQLMVTIYQAIELPLRLDGALRNPYCKLFLLPDRSERSQRRSKTSMQTNDPVWNQTFIYPGLRKRDLEGRVLEITLWDYDRYGHNEFLGEVLLDLSLTPLDNQPRGYTLTDIDDDLTQRARLRSGTLTSRSSYNADADAILMSDQPFLNHMGALPGSATAEYDLTFSGDYDMQRYRGRAGSAGHRSDMIGSLSDRGSIPRSHTYIPPSEMSAGGHHMELVGDPFADMSDHGNRLRRHKIADTVPADRLTTTSSVGGGSQRQLPQIPADLYGEEAMRELSDKALQMKTRGHVYNPERTRLAHPPHRRQAPQQRRALPEVQSPPLDSSVLPGYTSDGSESMSITSTQSERPRTKTAQEFQTNLETAQEEAEYYQEEAAAMSDSAVTMSTYPSYQHERQQHRPHHSRRSTSSDKDRRKSGMLGKFGIKGGANFVDRRGFARSEEIGIPPHLSPQSSFDASLAVTNALVKQSSRESTDSSESVWAGVQPGDLGEFIQGLGPGQVVGRQVLASPSMGELQLGLVERRKTLEVEIIRARDLKPKAGSRVLPATFVKAYLVEGKQVIAKAKTSISRRTQEPLFQQQLVFTEPFKGRFLQVTVFGDYGPMERKVFQGMAQIRFDDLDLSNVVIGWYKLFHHSSMVIGAKPQEEEPEDKKKQRKKHHKRE